MLDLSAPVDASNYVDFPLQVLTESQNRLLQAANKAWVFGGMGTWNDTGPQDAALHSEYESISNRLYGFVNTAILDSVNYSSPVFDMLPLKTPMPKPKSSKSWWKFW
jgi:hypothetical protein